MPGDNGSASESQGAERLTGRNDAIGGGGGGGDTPPSDPPPYYPPTPPVVPEPQTLALLITGIYFLRNKLLMKKQFS